VASASQSLLLDVKVPRLLDSSKPAFFHTLRRRGSVRISEELVRLSSLGILWHLPRADLRNSGNASVLPATNLKTSMPASTYVAFDTGPGNVLIDAAMRIISNGELHYDHDGTLGLEGESTISSAMVDRYLDSEPYFQAPLPKTTGRELFSDDVARKLVEEMQGMGMVPAAIVATITRITAESIARAYKRLVMPLLGEGKSIDEIYICGGGAHNPNILKHLQAEFPEAQVMKLDDAPMKLDPSAKEAVLFALLGFLAVSGKRVPIAGCAETTSPAILGVITPGANYHQIMKSVVTDEDFGSDRVLGRIIM